MCIVCLSFQDPQSKFNWRYKVYWLIHDWVLNIWQWANGKHFLSASGNIQNSNVAFYDKTTACLGTGVWDLSVVTPV